VVARTDKPAITESKREDLYEETPLVKHIVDDAGVPVTKGVLALGDKLYHAAVAPIASGANPVRVGYLVNALAIDDTFANRIAESTKAGVAMPELGRQTVTVTQDEHPRPTSTLESLASLAPGTWSPKVLTPHQNDTVIVLSEIMIPQTDTPGAKAALVNQFIDSVLEKSDDRMRDEFLGGLTWLDVRSKELSGKDFMSSSSAGQLALLTPLSKALDSGVTTDPGVQFFQAVKGLTIAGYYSSEIGMMQELGDDGQMFLLEFKGCTHPEHQV
jgi:hypothetical protein